MTSTSLDPRPVVAAMYADHHPWLRRWLQDRLKDRHCAEDLAHDTFMRLLAKDEAIVPLEPRALLTTVAKRVLFNHWRRKQIEAAWLETLAVLAPAHHPSLEQQRVLLEALLEVDRWLDGLPVAAKRAFLLTQLEGCTSAQAAARLGLSVTTIKRHLVRAMQQCYFADVDFASPDLASA